MMEAHLRGIVDYRNARLLDPSWWRRLWLLCRETRRQMAMDVARAESEHYARLHASPRFTVEAYPKLLAASMDAHENLIRAILHLGPPQSQQEKKQELLAGARAAYESVFGKINTPEFQEKMKNTVDMLKSWQHASSETPQERILRRSKTRAARKQKRK